MFWRKFILMHDVRLQFHVIWCQWTWFILFIKDLGVDVSFLTWRTKSLYSTNRSGVEFLFNFIIVLFFLMFADTIGFGPTFYIFSSACIFAFFFTLFNIPEIKEKSSDDILKALCWMFTQILQNTFFNLNLYLLR